MVEQRRDRTEMCSRRISGGVLRRLLANGKSEARVGAANTFHPLTLSKEGVCLWLRLQGTRADIEAL